MLHEVLSMPSLSGVMRTLFCLLLWKKTAAQSVQVRCSVGPVGALHPVQGRLERFDAGPGCAARERGDKETHVIAVGRVTNSPENKVTVLLKPFSLTPLRNIHLLLSSKIPVSWWLEAEKLPPNVPVLVQVSSNSSVHTSTLHLNVQTVHSLPFHPRALHRWALKHHGNLSSFTHTTHGNRVYVPLGEDPSLPAVCQLQSVFLSNSYVTSDLQTQEVQGCSDAPSGEISVEVHVIKLHSAGSGLCGSLQVEVIVSLLPLKVDSRTQTVVLILSSSVPVNWAIHAPGVRGQVSVYSSHSVSPPYPAEPDLTLSITLTSDLSSVPDLLVWTRESGHPHVTSYTEADLANRFVIQLSGGGTDVVAVKSPVGAKPRWAEERQLRQWLSGGGRTGGGREIFTVQCEDGRLSVSVDQHILQSVSVPVVAVTLRDSACQSQSNGSHFLLVFPVISCGTEVVFTEKPRGVQYKNMVLLWRADRQSILTLNETELKSSIPLSIPFSCLAGVPPLFRSVSVDNVNSPEKNPLPWATEDQGLSNVPTQPRNKSWPVLILKLFVTESYEQRRIGPCVITADQRVYVEISAKGSIIEVVEVKSCAISPLSDSKKSPFWSIISDGCSSDQSLTLTARTKDEDEEGDGELEEENEEIDGPDKDRNRDVQQQLKVNRRGREAPEPIEKKKAMREEIQPLRFSFILRPVYNNSVQFLHCSLLLCTSESKRGESTKETGNNDCEDEQRIPPLVSRSTRHQCEIRNLSRPMVVTVPISSLAPKPLHPPAGPTPKNVSPMTSPDPEHSSAAKQTGLLMGVVFIAFVMGASLMGGVWCIYYYTGRESHLTANTREGHTIYNPLSAADQSSSSV
ncbi:transforming growth factor beta receptor type 3 [Trematomus bernacchii]|uniref:transforming growth factor beta receptor type 3 n=1 Tax=Trematomus bernacchii TaxID=40690 RepID=UPI00146D8E61|nr:transforming growth factor beta receptor type 3 [Trematomus bernacchii]